MNREIKFRAWDEWNNKFIYFNIQDSTDYDKDVIGIFANVEKQQYTGLKDKNEKEIYEGDILEDDVGDILEVKFGELPLDKTGDCVCTFPAFYLKNYGQLGKSPMYKCQEIGSWMKVVGNIYENPNFLSN